MARPMMKPIDVGEAALTIEPTSKMMTQMMKTHLTGKKVCGTDD